MDKKSTLCLWVDGIGLSSSWSGNAFMSANPKNFLEAWSHYRSTTVSPCFNLKSGVENSEIDFARVNGGENYPSDKTYLDQYIQNDQLVENEKLKVIINETVKRNSAVHLIGNLPSESEAYSSFVCLKSLLEYLHHKKRIQVYIHLILGDDLQGDQKSLVNYLVQYYEIIKKYPSIETASISGQNSFSNSNSTRETVEAIVFGRGESAITLEQAFSSPKGKQPFEKQPTSIIYRDSFTFKIKNFDTVLFFNHNTKHLSSFMQTLTADLIGSLQMPKFLQVSTFFDPLYKQNNKIINILHREFEDKLMSTLNNQYNFSIVLDKEGVSNLNYLGILKNYRTIGFDNYELTFENLPALLKGENKFSIIYLNLLSKLSSIGNFKEAEIVVKEFDRFFGKVIKYVEKENVRLILFSSKAGLERLTNRNNTEKMSQKTISSLPFTIIDKENKKSVSSKTMFYDMIKDRQSLVDIAPTIFDLMSISNKEIFIGNSFIKGMK